jgi:Divergent InlB B-repeat domain
MAQQDKSGGPSGGTPEQPRSPWTGWALAKVLVVAVFALAVSAAVLNGLIDGDGGGDLGGAPPDSAPAPVPGGGGGESTVGAPAPGPGGGEGKRTEQLSVATDGEGSGAVISDPPGINCSQDCAEEFPAGNQVILTARPSKGSILAGFSGDCSGTDPCTVIMNTTRSVTATFEPD